MKAKATLHKSVRPEPVEGPIQGLRQACPEPSRRAQPERRGITQHFPKLPRPSILGLLGWLLPLAVAITAGYWLNASRPSDDARRVVRARDEIRAIGAALLASSEDKALPGTASGLQTLVADGILPNIPADPWGRPYQYRNPGTVRSWELYSLGADGVESADDIVHWNLYGGR